MISTGFKALDRVIGGLKEGKLYGPATFNFDHGTAEYFVLNMIAKIQRPAFFHSGLMESARMTASAFAEWSLFCIGDMDDDWPAPPFPRGCLFSGRETAESAEELCERFETYHRNTPFELAVFDIREMRTNGRARFASRKHEMTHIVGLFQTLAERNRIPVILLGRFDDRKAQTPPADYLKPGDCSALLDVAENIMLLSRAAERRAHDFDLTVFKHFVRPENLPVYQYARKTPSGNPA